MLRTWRALESRIMPTSTLDRARKTLWPSAKGRLGAKTVGRKNVPLLPRLAPIPERPIRSRGPSLTEHGWQRWHERVTHQDLSEEWSQVIPFGDCVNGQMLLSPCGAVFIRGLCG